MRCEMISTGALPSQPKPFGPPKPRIWSIGTKYLTFHGANVPALGFGTLGIKGESAAAPS